jgi:hypothetical protein
VIYSYTHICYNPAMKKTDWGTGAKDVRRTSLNLPVRTWKLLKILAVNDGRNAQELVAEALDLYLKKRAKEGGFGAKQAEST